MTAAQDCAVWIVGAATCSMSTPTHRSSRLGGSARVIRRMLAKQHGADPSDAEDAPVQLAHLAEDVGLLNPLHDPSLVKTNVVEVAGLVAMFGRRRTVQPSERGTAHGASGDREVRPGREVVQLYLQIRQPFQIVCTDALASGQLT